MDDSPIQTALCVIGHPIGGNPTQFVASRALAALGLDWQFVSFDVEPSQIEKAIQGVDSLGFRGAIIASPYQTKVAAILGAPGKKIADAPAETSIDAAFDGNDAGAWFDCLIRDDDNRLVAHNLYAETFKNLIDSHAARVGQALTFCLLLDEPQKLDDFVQPLKRVLPPNLFCVVGSSLAPWPADRAIPKVEQTTEEGEDSAEPTPTSLSELPWLILWGLDTKPRKKASSKSPPILPSPASVAALISQLHPGSLLIDLSGTSTSWLEPPQTEANEPIVIVTTVELELLRLTTALTRWTGKEPNVELMREAIEEYLEV
jgi:hypothetical protein